MKKVLLSLLSIGVVAGVAVLATGAFFSDTETSVGNTITAGTIDISVDQNNPWSAPVTISDMKPSYVRWTRHVVRNVGNNPLKLWKHIKNVQTNNNGWSEQECTEALGTWTPPITGQQLGSCTATSEHNNIDEYIVYDMYKGGNVTPDTPGNNWLGGQISGGTVVIDEDDGITVDDIESIFVYLGTLQPNEEVTVWQSYHMKDETGNWAQTDQVTFDIEFYAEQVNGNGPISGGPGPQTLLLENKDGSWNPIIGDGKWGVLKWAGNGSTFNFSTTLEAHGLLPSINYSLIYYPEPQTIWPWPVTVIKSGNSNPSGNLTLSDDINLGIDLTNAKLWLAVSSDIVSGAYTTWPPTDTLFEYNLINYDDTDI